MNKNTKSVVLLILSILFLIFSFLNNWYICQLYDAIFLLAIIPYIILMFSFNVILVLSIKLISKDKMYINILNLIFLTLSVILFKFFPFTKAKVRYEVNKYEKQRLEIIEKIKNNDLKDVRHNIIELPKHYKKISTGGEVYVYQNDENGQVIGFWEFHGMQSGSIIVVYSTGGEELIRAKETGHPIIKVEKLKDGWYYVETDE